jgi:hypothetical protein
MIKVNSITAPPRLLPAPVRLPPDQILKQAFKVATDNSPFIN